MRAAQAQSLVGQLDALANQARGRHALLQLQALRARAQTLILAAFALLAICASLSTLVAARLAWRGWTKQVVRFIRGGTSRSEFQPIMRDVRELIERIWSGADAALPGSDFTEIWKYVAAPAAE